MRVFSRIIAPFARSKRFNYISIFLAFFILFLFYIIPYTPDGLSHNGKMMIGILLAAAILWITEPIPLPATGLLIMVLQPLLGIIPSKTVFSSFGNEAVFFLIGAFVIAAAIEKHGLHKRIALRFLTFFEHSPKSFTFGIMFSCALLSFIMPEHGVAALFLPIISSILLAMKIIPKQSNFGIVSMLSLAYGCSIGSLGTLVGGARNPLTIGFLSEIGINVTFLDWMIYSVPVVFISLPIVWLILQISFPLEITDITVAKKEISNQVVAEGKIGKNEILVLSVLILTIILWVFFSHQAFFGLATIALIGSLLLFITRSINWKDVEKRVPWGVILLYGGAITLGAGMTNTGAGAWIAQNLISNMNSNPYIVIIGLVVFTIFLTEFMSNTGAVAVLLPIGLAISSEVVGISPLLSSMLIALSGGLAFMLVIATPGNAITYTSGYYSTRDLLKAGIFANISCILVLFTVAIVYWKGILGL
ncbi:MAG: DASS family sodium-coupled anion symporter [Candidatus Thermoplasmatota archaeon]|nr:DASS family sodium-coupled anion symporter [Candidatus Thermoplasmatota archaeon]